MFSGEIRVRPRRPNVSVESRYIQDVFRRRGSCPRSNHGKLAQRKKPISSVISRLDTVEQLLPRPLYVKKRKETPERELQIHRRLHAGRDRRFFPCIPQAMLVMLESTTHLSCYDKRVRSFPYSENIEPKGWPDFFFLFAFLVPKLGLIQANPQFKTGPNTPKVVVRA